MTSFKLFHHDWFDYQLNDQSWLRADTFSWQDGTVYSNAYQHLVADITGKTLQSETIGAITIQYYLADDGHKIAPASEESNVASLFTTTGVAWYYILDTTNQRFKLPRENPNREILGQEAHVYGDGTGLRLVNKNTPNSPVWTLSQYSGDCFYAGGGAGPFAVDATLTGSAGNAFQDNHATGVPTKEQLRNTINTNKSGLVVDLSTTTGVYKGKQYLYFYVGQFSQTATEQTAGLNSELFNGKMDISLSNMNPSQIAKETIVGWGMPDYSAGVSISSGYTATKKGIIYCYGYYGGSGGSGGGGYCWCKIGNSPQFIVAGGINSTEGKPRSTLPLYINAGETCTFGEVNESNASGSVTATFYPLKGVN